jgi:hypothetical protein
MNLYNILMSDDVILEINNDLEYILNIIPEIKPMIETSTSSFRCI